MSKKPLACRHCGTQFRRSAGAGLFCGDNCELAHDKANASNRESLLSAGFTQHEETPNIWVKDGVAVTEEQVKHQGLVKALHKHAGAVHERITVIQDGQ